MTSFEKLLLIQINPNSYNQLLVALLSTIPICQLFTGVDKLFIPAHQKKCYKVVSFILNISKMIFVPLKCVYIYCQLGSYS